MTPQERKLIDELFDRLESLENNPRDPDAVAAINDGLQRAPNAAYALVQTALVQDEALKHADARIRELEAALGNGGPQQQQQGGFLDSMRDALLGKRDEPRGSVPPVRQGSVPGSVLGGPPSAPSGPWRNTTGRQDYAPEPGYGAGPQPGYGQPGSGQPMPGSSGGGSFLGTAAATAAGVVGGALLANSFRHMFGGGQGHAAYDQSGGGNPWSGGGNLSNTDLARDAGVGDIGGGGSGSRNAAYDDQGSSDRAGLFDTAQNDSDDNDDSDDDDGGYDDGGDTDTA